VTVSKARVGRFLVIVLLIAGIAAAWRWRGLFDPREMTALIGANPLAPLVFILLHVAASLFFVPRTLLAFGAGLLFGLWWGIVWAVLGCLAGAVSGFLLARYLGSGFVERAHPVRLRALLARAERGGWRMVVMLRLVPIVPHSLTNYGLGLTRVRLGAYVVGSLLGQLPLTIAYVDLGTAGGRALLGTADWHQVLVPSLIGLSLLALSLLLPVLARRRMRQLQPVQPVSGA
jgi:uncharacterized membrane protein YdjX (TVP38/TMEM64 family)